MAFLHICRIKNKVKLPPNYIKCPLIGLNNENGCNIPPIKGAKLDKPSEMMAFSLSISELG